jgi:hypothetical protein
MVGDAMATLRGSPMRHRRGVRYIEESNGVCILPARQRRLNRGVKEEGNHDSWNGR